MKILSLSFGNLNSLYGTWTIDFTAPGYRESGIFAITGPTGSGKSTLLDALCLALYARTPRLTRVNKSANEIMSRHTGECFAEAVFETPEGSFTAHWSQRRARGKPGGALQDAKHELAHTGGAVIENKLSEIPKKIEEITGMDFERFTRSMLLAQGGFAAFLNADADERSPILEQITGTGIYSVISIKVHERLKMEREALGALKAELDGIMLLTDEELAVLAEKINAAAAEMKILGSRRDALQAAREWLRSIAKISRELVDSERKLTGAQEALEAFESDDRRLSAALRASELEGDYSVLAEKRRQFSADSDETRRKKERLPQLSDEVEKLCRDRAAAEDARAVCNKRITEQAPLIRQVRELDNEAGRLKTLFMEAAAENDRVAGEFAAAKDERERYTEESAKLSERRRMGITWCEEHKADAGLAETAGVLMERVRALNGAAERSSVCEYALKETTELRDKARHALERCVDECGRLEREKTSVADRLNSTRKELDGVLDGKTLTQCRHELDALRKEKYYVEKIISLEKERKLLVQGEPCPLCGSKEHPFTDASVPEVSDLDRTVAAVEKMISRVENLEERIAREEKALGEREKEFILKVADTEKTKAAVELHDVAVTAKKGEYAECNDALARIRLQLEVQLAPFGLAVPGPDEVKKFEDEINKRKDLWKAACNKLIEIEQDEASNATALALAEQNVVIKANALSECEKIMNRHRDALAECMKKRNEIFGDQSPDMVEKENDEALNSAETRLKQITTSEHEKRSDVKALSAEINAIEERIENTAHDLRKKEAAFLERCLMAGFPSVDAFTAALLDSSQRNGLDETKKRLKSMLDSAAALVEHRKTALEQERTKMVTTDSAEDVEAQIGVAERELQSIGESIGAYQQRRETDDMQRKKIADRKEALDAQHRECLRWERLHALIGSSDGKKFRNFAQGITFEYLIAHANRQLSLLSDRYLLTSCPEAPLDLFVIDNYQAAEIRTTRNLSGGESFIISLALALGLSSMAGRTVRVDSLFLDEGFGTLDEDALETALETLASLHQDGKCIGVISHVQALKERIAIQIAVTPVSGGKSVLSGPGCSHRNV